MANHKSALKRMRQNEKRRLRNKARKTRVKNLIKAINKAIEEKSLETAQEKLRIAQKVIDRTAAKGTLHHRNAARKISRIMKRVNNLSKKQAEAS